MTTSTGAPTSGVTAGADGPVWHTLSADRVLQAEKVDKQSGLSSAEAASRAERFGPNKFDAGTAEPRWRAFIRQYADLMQIVLLAAGLVSLVLQEWETGIVLILLTLFQRRPRPAAGGEGRHGRRRPTEDDDHQSQGEAGPPATGDPGRAARFRRPRLG